MQGPYLRKYGVQATINFVLFGTDGVDLKIDAVHAAGDTKLMKDEGVEANTTNAFTDEGQGYSLVLTATEMQAARIVVYIVDAVTKVWLDTAISIETYGNASAMHAVDLDDGVRAGLTALPNAAADAAGGLPISDVGGLDLDAILTDTNALNDTKIPDTISLAAIADGIWDEAKAGHVGVGSFGEEVQAHALSSEITALNDPTAAAIADAVWDEARAGHVAAGSFGQGVASVQGNVTGSVASVTGAVASVTGAAGSVTGSVGSVAGNVVGSVGSVVGAVGSVTGSVGSVVGAVGSVTGSVGGNVTGSIGSLAAQAKLDVNAEADTALTDIGLDHLLAAAVIGTDVVDNSVIARMVSKSAIADWDSFINTTDALEALRDNQSGSTPAAIADAVWDEARAGHVAAGSFGQGAASVQGNLTGSVGSVTGAVGSVTGAVGSVTGSVGSLATQAKADVNLEADTALSDIGLDHLLKVAVVGTDVTDNSVIAKMASKAVTADWDTFINTTDALEALSDSIAGGGADVSLIADAVWDELRAGHVLAGSFGQGVATVQGNVTGSVASVAGAIGSLGAQAKLDVNVEADTALTDFAPPTKTEMLASFAALNNVSLAQITTEISDALSVDTIPELTQAQPAATPTMKTALMCLYMALRNKRETTATRDQIYNDAGTQIAKAVLSDDGVTVKREKFISGS